ncbi:hypothetical protein DL98DRAFT_569996 [Cadophora sp. DSE1049]|nr:hypothetical protein DL98DRAFT_569996 [Cadophora sp. DSE1049]
MLKYIHLASTILLLAGIATSDLHGCSAGGACSAPSQAMLKCGPNNSRNLTVMSPCICAEDPTWDKDILDWIQCWVEPISNGGNDYELGVDVQESMFISCGPPIDSSVELFPCILQCRTIWQIGNTCGGYGEDVKECICTYHYSWDGAIESMYFANCPLCIEGLGVADVAATLRVWKTFGYPVDSSVSYTTKPVSSTTTTTTATTTSKSMAKTNSPEGA